MPTRWRSLLVLGFVELLGSEALAHKLPNFPVVRLMSMEVAPDDPLLRRIAVEVRDPAGKEPVRGALVTVRALNASGLRVEKVRLPSAPVPGVYRGEIRFPRGGRWELTIDVVGRYVGDAHLRLDIGVPEEERPRDKPELSFNFVVLRHLAMEWGHLVGFALWLGATGVGLLHPGRRRGLVLLSTWMAFAIEGGTGLYKMEYGTPFAGGLELFNLSRIPGVFFAEEYVLTLVAKHTLMVTAIASTLVLTLHAWQAGSASGVWLWRALLGMNLVLALAIALAAAVLGFYHGIILHFS